MFFLSIRTVYNMFLQLFLHVFASIWSRNVHPYSLLAGDELGTVLQSTRRPTQSVDNHG